MRFTHPVNTLKKLGCGLAFGAAAIMAMPTSALACTQIYMGSKLTEDKQRMLMVMKVLKERI